MLKKIVNIDVFRMFHVKHFVSRKIFGNYFDKSDESDRI